MKVEPAPENEGERLAALRALRILDTPPEAEFDDLVAAAALACGAPIALLSLSDAERQWFKSRIGVALAEIPRHLSFCAYAILQEGTFVVPDAAADPRFANSALVRGALGLRFYAGAVLRDAQGYALGTLCVLDKEPRTPTAASLEVLRLLAGTVGSLLELRARRLEEEERLAEQRRESALLAVVSRSQSRFLRGGERREVFADLLDGLLAASESEYGFIGEVLRDRGGAPYLRTYAISDLAWDHETRALIAESREQGLLFRNLDTLFGAAMRTEAPVIANDPGGDPRRGGLPKGHPELRSFLGVPCLSDGAMIGMIGIANRPGGYDQALLERLDVLLATCTALFRNLRLERLRAEAEDERRRSEARLHAIVEAADDAIASIDRDGIVVTWNAGAERIFGWVAAEIVGRSALERLIPARRRALIRDELRRFFVDDGGPYKAVPFDLVAVRRDGAEILLELTGAVTEVEQVPVFCAIARDVSARKAAERAVSERSAEIEVANRALARALRVKDAFMSTINHELRTPLQGVLGIGELLASGYYGPLTAPQLDALQSLSGSAEALLHIVNDVLDLNRIEAGDVEVTDAVVDLAALVDACVRDFAGAAAAKAIELRAAVDPALPRLRGDPQLLAQALRNIVGNAVKFTERGSISIVARRDAGGPLEIEVVDTGVGIAAADLERIVRPFTQVDGGLARRHSGIGLGLTLSLRLVELLGGELRVHSVPGEGSRFTVRLPWPVVAEARLRAGDAARRDEPDPPAAVAGDEARPLQVLLVEDNEVNILAVSAFLEVAAHRVVVARDGNEALVMVEQVEPDLVLMDIQMPVMDGFEATRRLRARPGGDALAIIALTAKGSADDRERGRAVGFDAYLCKPVTPALLEQTIQQVLRRRRAAAAEAPRGS
ncbi:MAG: ATP-binding protein [Nannocystaceae bacterium]